jgi:hypothetical protein
LGIRRFGKDIVFVLCRLSLHIQSFNQEFMTVVKPDVGERVKGGATIYTQKGHVVTVLLWWVQSCDYPASCKPT